VVFAFLVTALEPFLHCRQILWKSD